jgi:hypothetical protein
MIKQLQLLLHEAPLDSHEISDVKAKETAAHLPQLLELTLADKFDGGSHGPLSCKFAKRQSEIQPQTMPYGIAWEVIMF